MSFQTSRPRMPVRITGNPEAIFVPGKSARPKTELLSRAPPGKRKGLTPLLAYAPTRNA
jgi:hypothetical protein